MFRPLSRPSPALRSIFLLASQPADTRALPNLISRPFSSSPRLQSSQSLLTRLSRRAWYKKDGITPRSKTRGLLIATGLSTAFLLFYSAMSLLWEIEDLVLLLAAFIQLQQVDSCSYSSADTNERNWDDWKESVLYFKSICKPVFVTLTWAESDHVDRFFAELEDVVTELDVVDRNQRQSENSLEPESESLKTRIHNIMNDTSHAVHRSLLSLQTELGGPNAPSNSSTSSRLLSTSTEGAEMTIERASEIVHHIREAIEAILRALQDRVDRHVSGEIDKELSGWFKAKGEGTGTGKGGKGRGYDIIG